MFNIFKWTENAYQIIFGGASFYFSSKLPVAFQSYDSDVLYIRDERIGRPVIDHITLFSSHRKKIKKLKKGEFIPEIKRLYRKVVIREARQIAIDRLSPERTEENEQQW